MHTLVVGKWVGLLYFEMWYSCFREKDFTGNPSAKKRPTFRTVYAQCRVLLPTPALKPRAFRNFSFLSSSCRTRRVPGAAKSESPAPAEAKGKGKQEDAAVAEKEEEEEPQRKEGMLQVGARSAEDGAGAATAGPALPPTVRGAGEGTRSTTHSHASLSSLSSIPPFSAQTSAAFQTKIADNIQKLEAKIESVEDDIKKVEAKIEKVEANIDELVAEIKALPTQSEDENKELLDEKQHLRDEKKQLREKEKQLRDEKKQLRDQLAGEKNRLDEEKAKEEREAKAEERRLRLGARSTESSPFFSGRSE